MKGTPGDRVELRTGPTRRPQPLRNKKKKKKALSHIGAHSPLLWSWAPHPSHSSFFLKEALVRVTLLYGDGQKV